MNPSASGWIEKFCSQINKAGTPHKSFDALYNELKAFGFIYGVNVNATDAIEKTLNYSEDELAKINLITGLYHIYSFENATFSTDDFIQILLQFYKTLEVSDLSLWDKLMIGRSESSLLERLINDRVKIDDNIITRNFNKSITNSLLFVDVLAFQHFITENIDPKTYSANLESIIVGTLYQSLNSKSKITDYDKQIIEVIEASTSLPQLDIDVEELIFDINYNIDLTEKQYLIDLMCLSIWDDEILETSEYHFLMQLANELNLDSKIIQEAMLSVSRFHDAYHKEVLLFQQKNPIANFYENSSQLVTKLIRRNSKRLVKEIEQSKELMQLISKSTHSDLSKEEQKKIASSIIRCIKNSTKFGNFHVAWRRYFTSNLC